MTRERLESALVLLREAFASVRLPLDLPSAASARDLARRGAAQVDDYLLPRLARMDAPLLAVVGGSTGSGKSTLVNSLLGRIVTTPGVLRPTTRSPVLVHHPDDTGWFATDKILPGLARSLSATTDPRTMQVVLDEAVPPGLALLDAPDIDSVVTQNRVLADQLLAAADLWLFVTSAARYADAVPWDYLRAAAARHAVVAVVLDRLTPAASQEVPAHLGQMMSQRGLGSAPLFAVPETEMDSTGLLPEAAVAPIKHWLAGLAIDAASRNQVARQTLGGAISALVAEAPKLANAVADQAAGLDLLRGDADQSWAQAVRNVDAQSADGSLLRGEVLARWQDLVGTGEFFRALEQKIGRWRDRIWASLRGEPPQAEDAKVALEAGLETLIREEGEAAAQRVDSAWQAHPAGRLVLAATTEDLAKASAGYAAQVGDTIRSWQSDVLELVSREGAGKKSAARLLALGVNGVGVALMIGVFAYTGGLVGAEVGVAGGTALLAQRLLEAVFGEDAARQLAKQAKADLNNRVEALMAGELARYHGVLDAFAVDSGQADSLLAAAAEVDQARWVEPGLQPDAGQNTGGGGQ